MVRDSAYLDGLVPATATLDGLAPVSATLDVLARHCTEALA